MAQERKFLFIPLAGTGYLFPAIRLAHILEKKGHKVLFAATADFELMLQSCGLPTIGIRNNNIPFLQTASWFNTEKAAAEIKVLENVIQYFKPDFLVTNPLALCAFLLAERCQIPLINIGYTEYLYPGTNGADPHKNWRIKSVTDYYNDYRAAVNLPPIACSSTCSPLIGNKYLLRSVPELSDQEDLPTQVQYIGDLYWEPAYTNIGLQRFITAARQAPKSVIYVQIGRLFEDIKCWELLLQSMGAMQMADFVIDIGRADYLQSSPPIPQNCYFNPFIPLGPIAGDIDFVLCSGQSTSVVSAILHGKPILCVPHSADSHELSRRLEAKGLAKGIYTHEELNKEALESALALCVEGSLSPEVRRYQKLFAAFDDEAIYDHTTSMLM